MGKTKRKTLVASNGVGKIMMKLINLSVMKSLKDLLVKLTSTQFDEMLLSVAPGRNRSVHELRVYLPYWIYF